MFRNNIYNIGNRSITHSSQVFKNSFFSTYQTKPFSHLNGTVLVAATEYDPALNEHPVRIIEIATTQRNLVMPPLRGPRSPVNWLSFNRSGTHLLAGTSGDNQLYLWQLPNETSQSFKAIGNVSRVAFNEGGTLLAVAYSLYLTGGWCTTIQVINITDQNHPTIIDLHTANGNLFFSKDVSSLAFHPKSTILVSGNNSTVNFWDLSKIEKNKTNKATPLQIEHVLNITQLVFDSTGNKLAGSNAMTVREDGVGMTGFILDLNTHQQIPLRTLEYWSNRCIAFSPNNKYIVTGGHYRRTTNNGNKWYSVVRLWDTNGRWLNEKELWNESYFFGYRQHVTSLVSFNDKSDEVMFVDTNGFIRESSLDGKVGREIGYYGNRVMGFCCPVKNTLSLKEEPTPSSSRRGP